MHSLADRIGSLEVGDKSMIKRLQFGDHEAMNPEP
jgi:hypothetical protein